MDRARGVFRESVSGFTAWWANIGRSLPAGRDRPTFRFLTSRTYVARWIVNRKSVARPGSNVWVCS